MTTRQRIVALLYGATLIGALAPSYAHVAHWWLRMVPPELPWLAQIAALVIEGSLFAALFGLQAVKRGSAGWRWVQGLLLLGAGASIYANMAWAIRAHVGAWDGLALADAVFGAILLPVYAVVTAHAAPYVWSACASRSRPERKPAAIDNMIEPAIAKPRTVADASDWRERVRAGEFDYTDKAAAVARRVGKHASTVGRAFSHNGERWVEA